MPTRAEIMTFVKKMLSERVHTMEDVWTALYRLLLDYVHGVPRITDANRLRAGVWRSRAEKVEMALATAMQCDRREVSGQLDILMRSLYPRETQRMNPVGIGFACGVVCLVDRFARKKYEWMMEARIGTDIFPGLTDFRRRSVDIVAFSAGSPFAVISSKWGIRHDRVRDPQEEATVYKKRVPSLRFFVVTNEFDSARLDKVLSYPDIDAVFHVRRDLVWGAYGESSSSLTGLKDLTDLFESFS